MDLKRLSVPNPTNFIPMETHRLYIGLLGFILPVACIVFGWKGGSEMHIQRSISAYYYTRAHIIFIGVLVLVSGFMLTYRGYDLWDRIVTDITGVFAALAAIFPTMKPVMLKVSVDSIKMFSFSDTLTDKLHLVFAGLLFAFFAAQCFFLFARTIIRWRRIIYYICGSIILVMLIVLIVLVPTNLNPNLQKPHIVFILEVVMLAAFGVAWLIKGKIFTKAKV